ncbi:hypothetical protein GCM10023145_30180 [Angustibacter luteus]
MASDGAGWLAMMVLAVMAVVLVMAGLRRSADAVTPDREKCLRETVRLAAVRRPEGMRQWAAELRQPPRAVHGAGHEVKGTGCGVRQAR